MKIFYSTKTKILTALFVLPFIAGAQSQDSLLRDATLEEVVRYAVKYQPLVQQSVVDEESTQALIRGKLADWYPQLNFLYTYQRNFQLQTNVIAGNVITFGNKNASSPQLFATQNLFNRDVLLASKTATDVRTRAKQITSSNKVDVAVNVTKAFYDVLATTQQIKLGEGDIVRLNQSLKTARDQYEGGIVDKTDFKRATITLKNTQATLKTNQELLKYKVEYLKTLMGYPVNGSLNIVYDTLQMENEIELDTLQQLDYKDRIDYKLLETQRSLQAANLKYAKWSFIPTVSAYGYWISNYFSNSFSELYDKRHPNTYAGITLALPIFQGGKRNANIAQQRWILKRADLDITNLKNNVNSQYAYALASYKGNLITYNTLKENVALAKEVYDIIQLQYKSGIKSYLEVITAETDLRNTRINYFNALYQVLASKIDVQKALGQINY